MTGALEATRRPDLSASSEVEVSTDTMGGTLTLRVVCAAEDTERAERDLRRVAGRVRAWAGRLSRFEPASDLSRLNAMPALATVSLRPTLAAVMAHARGMTERTEGTVDISMLDERLAAEAGYEPAATRGRAWGLAGRRRQRVLLRGDVTRFDLDGVAKGWIADRALALLDAYPAAMVDADGDIAVRAAHDVGWRIAIADPADHLGEVACLVAPVGSPQGRSGIATSGRSVHAWSGPFGPAHHLLDPSTGRPAMTDVVQATVIAESAAVAECLAKSLLIRGRSEGLALLARAGAWGAVAVLDSGDLIATAWAGRGPV